MRIMAIILLTISLKCVDNLDHLVSADFGVDPNILQLSVRVISLVA